MSVTCPTCGMGDDLCTCYTHLFDNHIDYLDSNDCPECGKYFKNHKKQDLINCIVKLYSKYMREKRKPSFPALEFLGDKKPTRNEPMLWDLNKH